MYIRLEPADFFMYRVIMVFDLENPDAEDQPGTGLPDRA